MNRLPPPKRNVQPPYAPDGVRKALLMSALVIVGLVFGSALWAATASLSGAVLASGTVVVASSVKKVQHAAGGTVGEILVRDGDKVQQGELLLRLDETIVRANLQIITKQLDELAIRKTRLIAEQQDAAVMRLPSILVPRRSDPELAPLIDAESKLFQSRRDARLGQKAQLRERIAQLRQEAEGLAAQQWSKGREIELVGKELEGAEKLWARNLIPIAKFSALQREAARLEGERAQLRAQHAQTSGRISEIELQIIQVDQDMRATAMKELGEATAKESELVERRVAAEDQLRHIEIRAPQAGMVHQLAVHTIGGVIGQGDTLMQIVPEGDDLVVEARIAPQDIDSVRAGQPAFIRFTAFDQRITPEVEAQVARVSADLNRDPQSGVSYYLARLSLAGAGASGLSLLPGMPAEVHIRTGDRTAMSYFLKPLRDQFARAFTER